MEFGFIADFTPAFVIAILLAAACITSGCLNVAVWNRTDPNIFVRRRNRERFDAADLALVFDRFTVGIEIREGAPAQLACDAGPRVVNVAKPGVPGGFEVELMLDTR